MLLISVTNILHDNFDFLKINSKFDIMKIDDIKPLIKALKNGSGKILYYYSPRMLSDRQKKMFERHGVKTECRYRSKAWFEIDMIYGKV